MRSPKALTRQIELEQKAWCNRRAPTASEVRLWQALRRKALGVWFRRQVPVGGRYVVDFLAPTAKLVVEVDGGYHAGRERADARRDRELNRLGLRVLRLPADLVMARPAEALGGVVEALAKR